MTLLVVQNDTIFVDSYQEMSGYSFSSEKILDSSLGKFAIIGCVATGCQAIARCERDGIDAGHDCDTANHSIVILRRPDDTIHVLYLGDEKPVFSLIRGTNSGGLQFVGGSAHHSFMAYFAEHGDVMKAFDLCAAYHRDVANPVCQF